MPKTTRIYTRAGDDGFTRLGNGGKVSKADLRIDTYGTVDELNAHLGAALASKPDADLAERLTRLQNELFCLGADLCVPEENKQGNDRPGILPEQVEVMEREIDRFMEEAGPLSRFILPGGGQAAAHLHLARTVCRRAERLLAALAARETVNRTHLLYLNRLSDLLFAMARCENHRKGIEDVPWTGLTAPDSRTE